MSEETRFTKTVVARLACPAGSKEAFFWDTNLPGFGVRCHASGARRYVVQYRPKTGGQRRMSLGDPANVRLEEAREQARALLARVRLGGDPQGAQKAARRHEKEALRVGELVNLYLAHAEKQLRPRSFKETERHLRGSDRAPHARPLHDRIATSVTRGDIVKLLSCIADASGGVTANRVRSSLSALWTWAMAEGLQEANPVSATRKVAKEESRERVLSDAEVTDIWAATNAGDDHDRIVRLLLLTGCRRDEVGRMHWSEIENDLWTLPGERTKNGLPNELPLPALAIAQLPVRRVTPSPTDPTINRPRDAVFGEKETGFSGWSRCKARLDERIRKRRVEAFTKANGRAPAEDDIADTPWTLHDLRRTLVTRVNDLGLAEPHVIEALVNHRSGAAKRGVAGVYNRAAYRDQKHAALAAWADHVAGLVGQPVTNITTLRRG